MSFQKHILLLFLGLLPLFSLSQKFQFDKVLDLSSDELAPFALENSRENLSILESEGITIKQTTENWIYITATPKWIQTKLEDKVISDFYFEYAPPYLLDDSARVMQNVDPVHAGTSPLQESYTGKGVLIGFVDSGLDYRHLDFVDQFGINRVMRYWKQKGGWTSSSPEPYGYGEVWNEVDIQNESFMTNNSDLPHGTTVAGIAAGNGTANGYNKGFAPESKIVFVETDFGKPNWSLTVADACDYIFKIADSLNMPAVINLSVGSYLGSHDGTDPAAELMSQLVVEKTGRIIIAAAGNGGNYEPYHARSILSETDTSFIWLKNNPAGQLGENTVFFDLWSDINDAQFKYSFGANNPNKNYEDVASTEYRIAQLNVGTTIYDTLRNSNGDRIATLQIHTEYVGSTYHMQGFFSKIDSTDYYYRFSTFGVGKYDLWSAEWMDLNKLVTDIPSEAEYPPIVNYVMPDNLQSIVSSWNCHPNIVSVANLRARHGHITHAGNQYYPSDPTLPGRVALSSSRGPTRHDLYKPQISAPGDVTLASAPLYMIGNSSYDGQLGEGGYHLRNGGTSMAAPVISGIAALYLERCPNSSIEDFLEDLQTLSYEDAHTGEVPNFSYGYGKIDAFELLNSKNGNLSILGDSIVCQMPVEITPNIPLLTYNWSNGSTNSKIFIAQPDTIYLSGRDLQGCRVFSDTFIVAQGSALANPTISFVGDSLVSSFAPNYQWYFNDTPIPNATEQSYTPTENGYYSVAVQGDNNCKSFSNAFNWTVGIEELDIGSLKIYPNPVSDKLFVESDNIIVSNGEIYTIEGRKVLQFTLDGNNSVDVGSLSKGSYLLKLETNKGIEVFSFIKE